MKKAGTKEMLKARKGWWVGTTAVKPMGACKYDAGGKCSTDQFAEPYYCCGGERFSGVELVVCRLLNPTNPGRAGGCISSTHQHLHPHNPPLPTGPRGAVHTASHASRVHACESTTAAASCSSTVPAILCSVCCALVCRQPRGLRGGQVRQHPGELPHSSMAAARPLRGRGTAAGLTMRRGGASCSAATHTTHHSHASCAVQG